MLEERTCRRHFRRLFPCGEELAWEASINGADVVLHVPQTHKRRLPRANSSRVGFAQRVVWFAWKALWALNLVLLVGAVIWVFGDPWWDATQHWTSVAWGLQEPAVGRVQPLAAADEVNVRRRVLEVGGALAGLSGAALLAGLIVGPLSQRRLRSWLLATAVVGGWTGWALAIPAIAWEGQQWRIAQHLPEYQQLVESLQRQWPEVDGNREGLGAYSAYPYGRATLLLRLTHDETESLSWNTITRSPAGGLRFRLGGNERGVWLEWHPAGEQPGSYRDGLGESHQLLRKATLREGWFIVQYETPSWRTVGR